MPTYEYVCESCKKQFEIEQRITEPKLKKCPKCGKLKLMRLVGTGNFILKGGGWYADLYSSPPPSGASKSDGDGGGDGTAGKSASSNGKASGKSESKDGGKAASKPEAKPKKKPKALSSKGK